MPHIISSSSKHAAAAVLALSLASVGLAACGGSSSTTTTSANASAARAATSGASTPGQGTVPKATGPTRGALEGRFTALRECLQKNGITLPKFKPGQQPAPGSGGFLGGGGAQLPKGMTRAQYEAVLKKCGGGLLRGGGFGGVGSRLNSSVVKQALTKFAACMREHGVNLPTPNTSGKGPVFDTKGLSATSPQFISAETKCRTDLQGAFRARAGAPGASTG